MCYFLPVCVLSWAGEFLENCNLILMKLGKMDTIASGVLLKCKNSIREQECLYEIVFLNENDIFEILELQDIVIENLTDKTMLAGTNAKELEFRLENGEITGTYSENKLIGCNVLYFPDVITNPSSDMDNNLGAEIDLPSQELGNVTHLQLGFVHPDFRGNNLYMKMITRSLMSIDNSRYYHICATVAPMNYYSLRVFLGFNFVIKRLKKKYKSSWRYILYKNTKKKLPSRPFETISVGIQDLEKQLKLLNSGFKGIQLTENVHGNFDVIYGNW